MPNDSSRHAQQVQQPPCPASRAGARQMRSSASCSSPNTVVAPTTSTPMPITVATMPSAGLLTALQHAHQHARAPSLAHPARELDEDLAARRLLAEDQARHRDHDQQQRRHREHRVVGERRAHAGRVIGRPRVRRPAGRGRRVRAHSCTQFRSRHAARGDVGQRHSASLARDGAHDPIIVHATLPTRSRFGVDDPSTATAALPVGRDLCGSFTSAGPAGLRRRARHRPARRDGRARSRWLTPEEFLEDWAVAQVLPGPQRDQPRL